MEVLGFILGIVALSVARRGASPDCARFPTDVAGRRISGLPLEGTGYDLRRGDRPKITEAILRHTAG
jgi:hypothetical protein